MGLESQIEPWSPTWPLFCFVGFGTDGLRREEALKTAASEKPNRWDKVSRCRAHGAAGQNTSCSFKGAANKEKFQPLGAFFLLTPFIELIRTWELLRFHSKLERSSDEVENVKDDRPIGPASERSTFWPRI